MWRFATGPGFSTPASAKVSGEIQREDLEPAQYCDSVYAFSPAVFNWCARTWSFPMKDVFERYLLSLSQDRGEKTEHSDRGALETLLNNAAHEADPGIRIIHEAKKVRGSGAPDFKVKKSATILGYVEDKAVIRCSTNISSRARAGCYHSTK
jgi:hypothetical protein